MAANILPANPSECEPDEFVLIYLKERIEWDGKYTWFDAPQVRQPLTPKCEVLKQAALLFEQKKIEKLKKMLVALIESRNLNFKSFKYVLDSCFNLLQERPLPAPNSVTTSLRAIPLLAIIAFSGFYARKLAELDEECGSRGEWRKDFRKEITQISIYASTVLQSNLKLAFGDDQKTNSNYSWEMFLSETENWMDQIQVQKSSLFGGQLTQLFDNLSTPPQTCVFMAAVALVASGIGAMVLGRRYLHLHTPT